MALQVVKAFVDLGSLKVALSKATGILGGIEGVLEMVELGIKGAHLVVMLVEPNNVSKDPPVIEVSHFSAELLDEGSWA